MRIVIRNNLLIAQVLEVAAGGAVDLQYPKQPPYPLGMSLLGKPFTGKKSLADVLKVQCSSFVHAATLDTYSPGCVHAQLKYNLVVIDPDHLIQQALDAATAASVKPSKPAAAGKAPKTAAADADKGAEAAAEVVTPSWDEIYTTVGKKLQPLQAKGKGVCTHVSRTAPSYALAWLTSCDAWDCSTHRRNGPQLGRARD